MLPFIRTDDWRRSRSLHTVFARSKSQRISEYSMLSISITLLDSLRLFCVCHHELRSIIIYTFKQNFTDTSLYSDCLSFLLSFEDVSFRTSYRSSLRNHNRLLLDKDSDIYLFRNTNGAIRDKTQSLPVTYNIEWIWASLEVKVFKNLIWWNITLFSDLLSITTNAPISLFLYCYRSIITNIDLMSIHRSYRHGALVPVFGGLGIDVVFIFMSNSENFWTRTSMC